MAAVAAVAGVAGVTGSGPAMAGGGAAGTGPAIRPDAITTPTWAASSTKLGAPGVTYTFGFTTTGLLTTVLSITMTVPAGTAGTPTIGSGTTPSGLLGLTVTLASSTLTISGITLGVGNLTYNLIINGLTNTSTAGTYTSLVTTTGINGGSGTSNPLTFGPVLTSPSSLTWAATLTGTSQSVVDAVSADQQFTASDATTDGAGWNITVSATTFSGTAGSFANSGTFVFNGSLASVTSATKPTTACVGTCVLPTNGTAYPVAITTAASSPVPVKVYSTAAGTGTGTITLGGHPAANPIGWWVNIPGTARAGSYATTVTIAITTGP